MNKKLIGLAFASILGILFLNLTCEPPSEAETTGKINGTISDATTSQPISGVMITTNPVTSSKTTDSEGNFLIEGVEPSTYTIQASKNGYKTNSTTVSVVAGEESSADIQLSPLTPELSVSATSLSFGTSSTNLTFTISNTGVGTLTWSIISSSNWITINPTSGSTESESDVVTVTVDRTGMNYGNYYETITIASNTNSKTVDIIMTVANLNAPQLSAYPISLDFGTSAPEMSFYISNSGTGMLTWNITDDKSWISYSPNSGTTESEADEINVNIDRTGFLPGSYTGNIYISSDGGNQTITVSMTIPDEPSLSVSTNSLDFGSSETRLTFDITNVGSGDLAWSVTDNKDWIIVSPTSGTNYSTINVSIDRTDLSPGNYSGLLTISSNGGTYNVEISMNVPANAPPTAIQLYAPTNINTTSMSFSWAMSYDTDFLSYKLYRSTNSNVSESSYPVTTIVNRYTTSYSDESLQDGTTYYYRLYVEDEAHQTTGSNIVTGATLSAPGDWGVFATMSVDLHWISALNNNLVYTVGDSGKIYKWNGAVWTNEQSPTTERLGGVAVIAQNDVWIAGEKGIWHFNGSFWSQEAGYPTSACYGMDYASSDSVWVAGVGVIHFYNGSGWITSSPGTQRIWDIDINNSTNGWAVSQDGKVFHYNGAAWSLFIDCVGNYSYGVWATNESNVWVGGYNCPATNSISYYYDANHWDGSDWTGFISDDTIYDIEGTTENDVWLVGYYGCIYHWNGSSFSKMNSPTSKDIT